MSIPHVIGTAVRFWGLGGRVDRRVLANLGVMSAAGGLLGALLQERATTPALLILFGGLLPFSSAAELTGFRRRMQFGGALAWIAVALMVEAARVPVYVWFMGDAMARLSVWIAIATIGVVVGTLIGLRLLARIPEHLFRRVVAAVLAVLGAAMVGRALRA